MIADPDKEDMDAVVAYMKKSNLGVTTEGTLEEFLGVNISRNEY